MMANPAQAMAAAGRKGDTELAHVGVGEMLIPKEVIDNDPGVLSAIIKAFQKAGADWRQYQVDEAQEPSINPQTEVQEFHLNLSRGGALGTSPWGRDTIGPVNFLPRGRDTVGPPPLTRGVDSLFGSSINPTTGLQEFGMLDAEYSAPPDRSSNPGSTRDSYTPVPGGPGDASGIVPSIPVAPAGPSLPAPGQGTDSGAAPYIGGGPTTGPVIGPDTRLYTGPRYSEGGDVIDKGAAYPSTMAGRFINENLGKVGGLIGGPAAPVAAGLNKVGGFFGGEPVEGPPPAFGDYREKSEGEDQAPFQQVRQKQLADVVRGFQRPDLLNQPGGLNLAESMTPEQMRAAIATRGVEGNDSRFRSQEAIQFFLNSIQRRAIDAQGNVQEMKLLPIERQYLRQVVGLKGDYPNTQGLLESIAGV